MDENGRTRENLLKEIAELRERIGTLEQAEEERRNRRIMAMARLAEDVAHDFNDLLTGIMGYANMLRIDSKPGSFAYQAAKTIEKSAERAGELAHELLRLSGIDIEAVRTPRQEPQFGSGNILLVDDDEAVCGLGADMLRALGYSVVTASSGEEAVEYYRRFGDEVDAVIVGMVMPDLGGKTVFEKLRALDPDVRAILSTGYARDERVQDLLDSGMCGFVQKPYTLAQLSATVRAALRQGGKRREET